VAIYATNPELKHSDIYEMAHKNKPLPFILVGTTAGTGSEVTGVSVLTNSDNGMKKSIGGMYSEVSFCDYSYTLSVPYDVTVSTAIDALAHVVEGYFSSMSSLVSEMYSEKAFSMLKNAIRHFYDNGTLPDENMRQELYTASVIAGLALNITGACFPHTMGYVLTEDFGIPHGRACGAFLVDYIHMAAEQEPVKAERMFEIMETTESELCDMIEKLSEINISMTPEQIDSYVSRWVDPVKNFSRTPGNFTSDTARKLLEKYL
jgi:alcohol dehydrogenase class IV